MKCPYCNKENRDGAKFCGGCGKSLKPVNLSGEAVPGDGSRSRQASGPVMPAEPDPGSGRPPKKKKRALAIVIAAAVIAAAVVFAAVYFAFSGGSGGGSASLTDFRADEEGADEEETDEEETDKEETDEEEADEEDETAAMYQLFYDQLDELTEAYGLFEESQTGTISSPDEEWLDPEGVMGAVISDLDSDGVPEMLVAAAQECGHYDSAIYGDVYHIMLYVYETEDGKVFQSASFLMGEYYVNEYLGTTSDEIVMYLNEISDDLIAVNLVEADGRCYILCEYQTLASAFADGSEQNFWLLEYTGTQLQYVCSFSQRGGGSSDFVYDGYVFEDGVCVSSDVLCTNYYSEDDLDPLYDDFADAVTAFFGQYGVQTADDITWLSFSSILPEDSGSTLVFEFANNLASGDWSTNTFVFAATLEKDDAVFNH